MKRYEYKALYDRVTIAMGAKEFGEWVFKKLNEWGAEGWFIVNYQTPMSAPGRNGQQSLTGELMATGCREVVEGHGELGHPVEVLSEAPALPVVEGLHAVQ